MKISKSQFRRQTRHPVSYHVFESHLNAGPMERYAHVENGPVTNPPETNAPNDSGLCKSF